MNSIITSNGTSATAGSRMTTSYGRKPTHNEITSAARALWEKYGRPLGQDKVIWLEAERRLRAGVELWSTESDSQADIEELLGEPADTIENRLQAFGDQRGSRSATAL